MNIEDLGMLGAAPQRHYNQSNIFLDHVRNAPHEVMALAQVLHRANHTFDQGEPQCEFGHNDTDVPPPTFLSTVMAIWADDEKFNEFMVKVDAMAAFRELNKPKAQSQEAQVAYDLETNQAQIVGDIQVNRDPRYGASANMFNYRVVSRPEGVVGEDVVGVFAAPSAGDAMWDAVESRWPQIIGSDERLKHRQWFRETLSATIVPTR